jgi:hypothetical protein
VVASQAPLHTGVYVPAADDSFGAGWTRPEGNSANLGPSQRNEAHLEDTLARHLFAILDDLTQNLAELKAALAPLALIGGTVVAKATKPTSVQRIKKGNASRRQGPVSAKRRVAMREQGRYMSAIRPLSAAQRVQVKKLRAAKGAQAAIALAHRLAR